MTAARKGWPRAARALAVMVVGLPLLALGIGLGAGLALGIPQNAGGMAAKGICSAAFVAHRPIDHLLEDDVLPASPVLKLIHVDIDPAARSVTGRFAELFPRTARLLPGRGCVLDVVDPAVPTAGATAASPPSPPSPPSPAPTDRPWPEGDAPASAAGLPANAPEAATLQRLRQVADDAMQGAGDPRGANPRGLAIVQHGQLLVLRTAPGFTASTPLHGWSMSKTVAAMLAYKRASETGLALDTPVIDAFGPSRAPAWARAWQQDARRAIRVSDLLYMRDGLASTEDYQPWGSVPRMLWGEKDTATFAAGSPAEAVPGTRWRYLSATANLLSALTRSRFADDADYWAYPAHALFEPIGARTATLETDTAGNWVGSSYLWASVADWARLGQLLLQDGRWGSQQVWPPGFLKLASTPATADGPGRGYGAQSWLLADPVGGDCRGQGLPADLVAMEGHWGQIVAVVPSRDAVIVRLGWTFDGSKFDECRFIGDVLRALPPGN